MPHELHGQESSTWYNWAGWIVISEEDSAGTLTRTYVGHTLAHVDGTNPSSGTYKYYFHDHLGSTRRLRAQDKSSLGSYEYTPYGEVYSESGDTSISRRYAMLEWDSVAQMHFAPFRHYTPSTARWLTRDPVGIVDGLNLYAYARRSPVIHQDPTGLLSIARCKELLADLAKKAEKLVDHLLKYDPVTDGQGGHMMGNGELTKPGGHYKEIGYLKRGVNNDYKYYMKKCICPYDDDDDDKPPRVPPWIPEAIHQEVELPVFEKVSCLVNLPGSDGLYNGLGLAGLAVGGVALLAAGGILIAPVLGAGGAGAASCTPLVPAAAAAF